MQGPEAQDGQGIELKTMNCFCVTRRHGGDRIDGKENVGELNDDQNREERGGKPFLRSPSQKNDLHGMFSSGEGSGLP